MIGRGLGFIKSFHSFAQGIDAATSHGYAVCGTIQPLEVSLLPKPLAQIVAKRITWTNNSLGIWKNIESI